MTTHAAAFGLVAVAVAMTILGAWPTGPNWIRWAGMVLAIPAVALFIATAPRTQR